MPTTKEFARAWQYLAVVTPRELPPNDGAISYGQAVVAAAAALSVKDREGQAC